MLRNGVDVDKLGGMVQAVKDNPKLAALQFSVHSEWKGGLKSEHFGGQYSVGITSARHKQRRTVVTDEPPEILGSDAGVSPAEMTLAALASCLMVGYSANAAALGINLKEVSLDLTGEGDLQGFMNLGNIRPGLSKITVRVNIQADAPHSKIKELHDYVNAHSPIWDTLAHPVVVESKLETGERTSRREAH